MIALRRRGRVPVSVCIETAADPNRWADRWLRDSPAEAQLLVEPGETVGRLDLRCLVGLRVAVHGEDPQRVAAVAEAAGMAGAKRVIATTFERQGDEFRTVSVTDSEGAMTWPQ